MPRFSDPATALSLLTRLPAPGADPGRAARAAWAWPLAGLAPATLAALAAMLPVAPSVAAGLALAVLVITTGALHEDGLADSADGLWGGWHAEQRLEIMKDSHLGTYGALALIISLGLRAVALAAILVQGAFWGPLLATAVLSRAAMLAVAAALPHARRDGLSRGTGRPSIGTTTLGLAIALSLAWGLAGGPACLAAALAAGVVGAVAWAKIGGQTGDILGATQQVAEIAVLVTLARI